MSASNERLLIEVTGSQRAPAELPNSGMLAIGSSPEKAGLVLDGQGVAEVHCAIGRTKDGHFAIKDLGSEYGTLVNGTKVSQTRLVKGDEILIGSIRLRIIAGAQQGTSSPAAPEVIPPSAPKKTPAARRKAARKLPKIQGYLLKQQLGKGAMGEVYLAVQISLDRQVALKVLSQKHEEDKVFVASFQAEARAAAALNHPNVVTVHDVGEQDGVHYLTMEYMDRSSLEERVSREGPLPWPIVLQALVDAASGLVYAESRGIVHRDIKPANLMQNHAGATKIADLGLATSITSEEAPDGERKIFGTPHFISPEQIKGEKADCRSDLYSLGSTAYRLLTGHTPFEGKTVRDILRDKLRGDPTPIHERAADVPMGLVRVVERLMRLEPTDRYPSATSLLRELERLGTDGQGEASQASGPGLNPKVLKFGLPLVIVLVLAMVGNSLFSGDPSGPQGNTPGEIEPDPDVAELPDENDPPDPGGPGDPNGVDTEIQERLAETAAENAMLRLAQQDLPPADRRDALRKLAREFLGTTAATAAAKEAERIDEALRASTQATNVRDTAVNAMLAKLKAAADLASPALQPGSALKAMAAVEGLEAFDGDDAFQATYMALQAEVISKSLVQFALVKEELRRLEAAGEFDAVRRLMTELLGRMDLPTFEVGMAPPRHQEITSMATGLRLQLDELDTQEQLFQVRQGDSDKLLLARELGPGSGFLDRLVELDFVGAAKHTSRLASGLVTMEARAQGQELAAKLELASHAMPLLWTEFGDWRRKSAPNPLERRAGTREAISADAQGLTLSISVQNTLVPWSAYGAKTKPLDMLFGKRLRRNYTAAEKEQIAALMHLSALAESLAKAGEMFAPGTQAVFTDGEAGELSPPYEIALKWSTSADDRQSIESDWAASRLLGRALAHASGGAWSSSVAELEQLEAEHGSSWLVLFLSDGTVPE